MNKYPLDLGVGGGALDQPDLARRPDRRVDGKVVGPEHGSCREVIALLVAEPVARHRREPDVGIEPDLMTRVAGQHRAAARLGHIADQEARPAVELLGVACEPLYQADELWMAPIAVA